MLAGWISRWLPLFLPLLFAVVLYCLRALPSRPPQLPCVTPLRPVKMGGWFFALFRQMSPWFSRETYFIRLRSR